MFGQNKCEQTALLVLNGELPSFDLIERYCAKSTYLVCADGAANALKDSHMTPNCIIGDLDSLEPDTRAFYEGKSKILKDSDQYSTDFEKALEHIILQGYSEVFVTGHAGLRFDHTVTNLSILKKYATQLILQLFDRDSEAIILHTDTINTTSFSAPMNTNVSLLPLPSAGGVVTEGLQYPLVDESLVLGSREGQSNQVIAEKIRVSISSGSLIVSVHHHRQ